MNSPFANESNSYPTPQNLFQEDHFWAAEPGTNLSTLPGSTVPDWVEPSQLQLNGFFLESLEPGSSQGLPFQSFPITSPNQNTANTRILPDEGETFTGSKSNPYERQNCSSIDHVSEVGNGPSPEPPKTCQMDILYLLGSPNDSLGSNHSNIISFAEPRRQTQSIDPQFRTHFSTSTLSGPHPSSDDKTSANLLCNTQNKPTGHTNHSIAPHHLPRDQSSPSATIPNVSQSTVSGTLCLPSSPKKKHNSQRYPKAKPRQSKNATSPSSYHYSKNATDLFERLVPLLAKVHKNNFETFLVQVLKECPDAPIHDVYNLLYNDDSPVSAASQASSKNKTSINLMVRQRGLEVCHLVVEAFKNFENFAVRFNLGEVKAPHISSVNFHELLRNILAIKIIFDLLEVAENNSSTDTCLSRISIYKAYYIICQQLIAKYPTSSNSLSLQQNIILGQSKLGKLTKLIFPHLVTKRLGKRGQSKAHYMGLKWNEANITKEILDLLELELPEIQDKFCDSRKTLLQNTSQCHFPEIKHGQVTGKSNEKTNPSSQNTGFIYQKPLLSFVDLSCKYPSSDCAPRIWKISPNTIPSQSKWAKDAMHRSVEILKAYGVDLDPLIRNFNAGIYSDDDPHCISKTVTQAVEKLTSDSSCGEISMHLYLAISLLIFPVILASDLEVAYTRKRQLQASLRSCITNCGLHLAHSASGSKMRLRNFTSILKRMIILSEMGSATVRSSTPERVFEEIFNDIRGLVACKMDPFSDLSPLEELCLRTTMLSFNAYNFDILGENEQRREEDTIDAILSVTRTFANAVRKTAEDMKSMPLYAKKEALNDVTPDVPHQIFKIGVNIFHEVCLKDPSTLKLPFPIMNYSVIHILKEMQKSSFHELRKRDSGLSQDLFKSWWMFSTMFEEYLGIMSEILALVRNLED
ncbi:hypothetical protein JCM33374_g6408 [Metschnikowia sp. JCM 33374]|nr:hypothetical protein JCM33374_g6408 [Metschnikowia sp. JCM 33374]